LPEEASRAETAQARQQTPTLHKAITLKRFDQEPSESLRPVKKSKHYACLEGKVVIETRGRNHKINVLLDTGSNIFLMTEDTARRLDIPTEARHSPLTITTFDGETIPSIGIFYTHAILLEIAANSPQSMISCEIANEGKYELIIPFGWWQNEHPLKNIGHRSRWVFQGAKCKADIEGEAVANLFEWDETVAYDEEAQYVGRIGREEEGGV